MAYPPTTQQSTGEAICIRSFEQSPDDHSHSRRQKLTLNASRDILATPSCRKPRERYAERASARYVQSLVCRS